MDADGTRVPAKTMPDGVGNDLFNSELDVKNCRIRKTAPFMNCSISRATAGTASNRAGISISAVTIRITPPHCAHIPDTLLLRLWQVYP